MADIFSKTDVRKLLEKKTIVFFGDSNTRALYKDFLMLLSNNTLITEAALKSKTETSFCGDSVVLSSEGHNGTHYRQERVYDRAGPSAPIARFYFITKCYSDYVVDNLKRNADADVIVFNSCLWDITRYGSNGVNVFKANLLKLMKLARDVLPRGPKGCLFIWCTTLPVSQQMRGGFLVKQVEFLKHTLRFDVAEANLYASKIVAQNGFDVQDMHYYFRYQIHRRAKDGIHWGPHTVRHMNNILLTHIALAWDRQLPNRFKSLNLDSIVEMSNERGTGFHGDYVFPVTRVEEEERRPQLQHPRYEIFNPYDDGGVVGRPYFHTDFTSDAVMPADTATPFFTANRQTFLPIQQQPQRSPARYNNNNNPFNAVRMAHEKRNDRKRFHGRRFNKNRAGGRRPRGYRR